MPKAKKRPTKEEQSLKKRPAKQGERTNPGKDYFLNNYLRMRLNLKRLRLNLKRKPQPSQGVATQQSADRPNRPHLASLPPPGPASSQQEVLAPPPRYLPSPPIIQFTPWTPIFAASPQSTPDSDQHHLQPFPNSHNKGTLSMPPSSSVLATKETQKSTASASMKMSQHVDNATEVNPGKSGSFDSPPSMNSIDDVKATSNSLVDPLGVQYLSDSLKPEKLHESYTAPKSVVPSQQQEKGEAAVDPSLISSVDSLHLTGPLTPISNVEGKPLDEGYIAPKRHQELNEGPLKSNDDTQSLQKLELNGLSHVVQYIPYDPDYLAHVYGNSLASISH